MAGGWLSALIHRDYVRIEVGSVRPGDGAGFAVDPHCAEGLVVGWDRLERSSEEIRCEVPAPVPPGNHRRTVRRTSTGTWVMSTVAASTGWRTPPRFRDIATDRPSGILPEHPTAPTAPTARSGVAPKADHDRVKAVLSDPPRPDNLESWPCSGAATPSRNLRPLEWCNWGRGSVLSRWRHTRATCRFGSDRNALQGPAW